MVPIINWVIKRTNFKVLSTTNWNPTCQHSNTLNVLDDWTIPVICTATGNKTGTKNNRMLNFQSKLLRIPTNKSSNIKLDYFTFSCLWFALQNGLLPQPMIVSIIQTCDTINCYLLKRVDSTQFVQSIELHYLYFNTTSFAILQLNLHR